MVTGLARTSLAVAAAALGDKHILAHGVLGDLPVDDLTVDPEATGSDCHPLDAAAERL
jgi:hypothetical protein